MGRPPLGGCWDKLARGNAYTAAFEQQIADLVPPDKRVRIPFEGKMEKESAFTARVTWRIGPLPTINDPELALNVGDALTNYRAALDHLAWIIVKRKGTRLKDLDRRKQRSIAFPLAARPATFGEGLKRNLPGVLPDSPIGKYVKSLQPYGRTLEAKAMRGLRNLSDRDKHRLPIPTFWYPGDGEFYIDAPGWTILSKEILLGRDRRPIKAGAPIVTAVLASHSMHNPKVDLKGEGEMYPGLGDGWVAVHLLQTIGETIEEVLTRIASLLKA